MNHYSSEIQQFTTLEELRSYHNECFIRLALRTQLGCEADIDALNLCISRFRQNLNPADFLAEIYGSSVGWSSFEGSKAHSTLNKENIFQSSQPLSAQHNPIPNPLPTEAQDETRLLLDEDYGVSETKWLAYLEIIIRTKLFKPLSAAGTPPPKATLWICIDAVDQSNEENWRRTVNTLDLLQLASEYPVKVAFLGEQPVYTESQFVTGYVAKNAVNIFSSSSELASFIQREDLVLFIKPGDELRPELHMALKYFGSFNSPLTLIDMSFRENEKVYPLLLHGVDPIHANHVDYFFSRAALSGAVIQDISSGQKYKRVDDVIFGYFRNIHPINKSEIHINIPLLCIEINKQVILDKKLEFIRKSSNTPRGISSEITKISESPPARVSVVICTKNATFLLRQLIRHLLCETRIIDIIIVSNNTDNPSAKLYLEKLSMSNKVKVLFYDETFNFSKQCNLGALHSEGDILFFLNDDICPISEDWLATLLQTLNEHSIDETVVGPLLLYPDQSVQHAGMFMGYNNVAGHALRHSKLPGVDNTFMLCAPRQVSCLTGAALIMSRTIFDNLNGFDPMLATYLQDVDFSLRVLNSGFKLVLEPRALLFHMESVSVKPELVKENVGRVRGNEYNYFNERWGSMIHTDEWMNLLIERSDESLRSLKV